jgi:hypothetical protein
VGCWGRREIKKVLKAQAALEGVLKKLMGLFVFAVASVGSCMAQCQDSRLTVSQELHDAGATLVGTVEAARPVPDSSFHMDGVNYLVHVDRMIKGKVVSTENVTIFSENSPTKFPMQVGKQYLLFVHLNYNTYEVDNCGNSGLLEAANISNVRQIKEYAKK